MYIQACFCNKIATCKIFVSRMHILETFGQIWQYVKYFMSSMYNKIIWNRIIWQYVKKLCEACIF